MYLKRFPNYTENRVKNPVRKKLYISLGIYVLVFIALTIPIFITQSDKLASLLMPGISALTIITLPFGLTYVNKKEIAFFVKYLDFQPTSGFQPSDEEFGTFVKYIFSPDGLVIKGRRFKENFTIPYSKLDFTAWAAFKGMGDMMTIFISIESDNKELDSEIFGFADPAHLDSLSSLRLDQKLFDYLDYYQVPVKDLDLIIEHRAALMKDNCKFFSYMFMR